MHVPIPQPDKATTTTSGAQVKSIYLIFDSHPRPDHPNGAAVQIFPSSPTDEVADYLMDLFQVDDALIKDPNLQWHVQLLGQVSYHLLAPAAASEPLSEYALNMQHLALIQRVNEAERKLREVESDKRRMQSKVFDLEQEVGLLKFAGQRRDEEMQRLRSDLKPSKSSTWSFGSTHAKPDVKGKKRDDTHGWRDDTYGQYANAQLSGSGTFETESSPWAKAPTKSSRALPDIPSKSSNSHSGSSTSYQAAGPSNCKNLKPEDPDLARSLQLAMIMQQQFDLERETFSIDQSLARAAERPKFDCGICMESFTDEAIAVVDGCEHSCCRECMRSHIQSKIEERRYPIPCPFCVASTDNLPGPGTGVSCKYFPIILQG